MSDEDRIRRLFEALPRLSTNQLIAIDNIIIQFMRPFSFVRNTASDFVSKCVLQEFGDALRVHHCFSSEPFTKDKFEYALEKVCNLCGILAARARRGNPGHDLTIKEIPFSLKTQADASIKTDYIHISKFMELGRGQWGDKVEDLAGLRDRFFNHMRNYERILTLRHLSKPGIMGEAGFHVYELVEIPKILLLEAEFGELKMQVDSRQVGAKPGYCTVKGKNGKVKYQLYFDGGSERKLQVRQLDKSLCTVHATWKFDKGLASPTQNIES